MNFKRKISLLLLFMFISLSLFLCGCTKTVEKYQSKDVWCVTFQLLWNDFMDKFTNGKPVKFVEGNTTLVDELNKKAYTADILSEKDYYKVQGDISLDLKKEIEKNIKEKFNEKSDILDMIDWNMKDSYLFYVMLLKKFTFKQEFDKLATDTFSSSTDKVKYFGIDKNSKNTLNSNVNVLFYNSENEYAVRLNTNENEEVILFRTQKDDSFENLYSYVKENSEYAPFEKEDELKVPYLSVDKLISYDELCGKKIEGTNFIIAQALQTIKFNLDSKGGKLKSEAVISVMKTALRPEENQPRYFMFDKPFVLFLKEKGKEKPYFAMNVTDTKYLVKE